jgi:xanthine/uracil/vitamin C permease (AzgA family)
MKIGSFEFNLRELAGSMGDFGTLFPLAIGYIVVCGVDPCGLLVTMGVANIVTGLVYRLPMPIEPMKVLAVVAIAQAWSPGKVLASGLVMGVVWLLMAATGLMDLVARYTPKTVVRGIQLSLGALLAFEGAKMVSTWWLLGLASVAIVLLFRKNRYAPAAVVLVVLGIVIMAIQGSLSSVAGLSVSLPSVALVDWRELWPSLRDGGLAQIPLTATNAVIATSALISQYWPDRRVTERQLSLNMGLMNLAIPFFGGMPLCHGAGGLAGQYYFGARTGGTNVTEGLIEIMLGLFLAGSIASIFAAFPTAIVGAMMFLVGIELVKFARDTKLDRGLVPMLATVAGSVTVNMAAGFAAGLAVHWLFCRTTKVRGADESAK